MHYTSVENIHKLTGPLFYDELKDELTAIEGLKVEKERKFKLNAFRNKIASLKFLDPACGSGNFLTETYLSLRKFENRVLEDLYGDQVAMGVLEPIQVSIDQFYGIEINDFAVEVAKTALWIAELQMLDQTREILDMWIDPLPLKTNENIVCGNALRMDWSDVLPAEQCSYILGNPPFVGTKQMSPEQKKDTKRVFEGIRNFGTLDYVACWYMKACGYIAGTEIACAFVSTNSICQGEQVTSLWKPLIDMGVHINFAYTSFRWSSEATYYAHVHVVIIGFSMEGRSKCLLISGERIREVAHINPYLVDSEDFFIEGRPRPLCSVPSMGLGCDFKDGGHYVMTRSEKDALILAEPQAERFIRPYMTGKDFLNRDPRYCIWLANASADDIAGCPAIVSRVSLVREFRLSKPSPDTNRYANRPMLPVRLRYYSDDQNCDCIALPRVSSEEREYVPVGWLDKQVIAGDTLFILPHASLYVVGVLMSQFHCAWMRKVCGRLETRYRYSSNMVYNTLVWPDPTPEQRETIEQCAQAVLDVRGFYPDKSLADLYDPDKMPDDLLAAHKTLDKAVEEAYGVDLQGDEEKIVAHLFKLYAEKTGGE